MDEVFVVGADFFRREHDLLGLTHSADSAIVKTIRILGKVS